MRGLTSGAATAIALSAAAAVAWAQHGHGGAGGHTEGHQVAQACASEFEKVVGDGRGFGLAFAADQNGYPGPMHVLELRDLLDAEARLRRLFADRAADEAAVRAAVADVERARSEVRLVHLLTHLKTRDLLTEAQRRTYHEARWATLAPAR